MHLQRKNKIICLERGSAALVVNGLLTHPVNLPCLLPHTHTTASGLVVLMLNELVLHVPALWKRLRKKRNCSCQSSTPLALNHVYFAIIYRLFSLSCCEIVNRFPLFQHSCYLFIFSFFPPSNCWDAKFYCLFKRGNNLRQPDASELFGEYFTLGFKGNNHHCCRRTVMLGGLTPNHYVRWDNGAITSLSLPWNSTQRYFWADQVKVCWIGWHLVGRMQITVRPSQEPETTSYSQSRGLLLLRCNWKWAYTHTLGDQTIVQPVCWTKNISLMGIR